MVEARRWIWHVGDSSFVGLSAPRGELAIGVGRQGIPGWHNERGEVYDSMDFLLAEFAEFGDGFAATYAAVAMEDWDKKVVLRSGGFEGGFDG